MGYLGLGMAGVTALVAFLVWLNRGSHIELRGRIQKVRFQAMDENSAVVILDFRFVNPANYAFVVRTVKVLHDDTEGKETEGMVVSEVDARRLFQYYTALGQKFNDSLLAREKVAPRHSMDRMIAARFEMPQSRLEQRARFRILVEDVDGAVSEISEDARKN